MDHDEIYLIDLWRILSREWRWFLATLVLVLAGTYGLLHAARSQWEALAWIQIGQVGPAPAGQDPKVEPLLRVIERMDTVGFQDQVTASLGLSHDSVEARLYRKSLKADPQPYANLFRLHIRAYSPTQATALAAATLATLQVVHRQIDAVPLQMARKRLDDVEAELRTAEGDRVHLQAEASGGQGSDATRALSGVMLSGKNADIRALRQEDSDIRARLAPNYTYETSMPWPVYVPKERAYPNTVLMLGMGGAAALFLAGIIAIARNAVRRRSTSFNQTRVKPHSPT